MNAMRMCVGELSSVVILISRQELMYVCVCEGCWCCCCWSSYLNIISACVSLTLIVFHNQKNIHRGISTTTAARKITKFKKKKAQFIFFLRRLFGFSPKNKCTAMYINIITSHLPLTQSPSAALLVYIFIFIWGK